MHESDKGGKRLIQHPGDSILRLAGLDDIAEWRPLQAEVVQPCRLPDGLIEARLRGQSGPGLFVLELATWAGRDRRVRRGSWSCGPSPRNSCSRPAMSA